MDGETRLNEILSRWEEAKRHGQSVAAEELCSGCPELLPEVIQHIEALQKLDPFVSDTERCGQQPTPPQAVPETRLPDTRVPEMPSESSARLPAFPGYEIESELGRGGMGVVYLARQTALNRVVALKVIRGGELASSQERGRFLREAATLAKLRHPNLHAEGSRLSEPPGDRRCPLWCDLYNRSWRTFREPERNRSCHFRVGHIPAASCARATSDSLSSSTAGSTPIAPSSTRSSSMSATATV